MIWSKIFGDQNSRVVKSFQPLVDDINALEPTFEALSDEELRDKSDLLKKRIVESVELDGALSESFALVREAAKRTLGERHFDVQLMGGVALHKGNIAEMKTGEGKTLVATLPAYLNALSGRGVHIVTVNDYLARRDAVWMGQIYHALGMKVGCITQDASYIYDPTHSRNQESGIMNNGKNHNSKLIIHNSNSNGSKKEEDGLDMLRDAQGSFRVVHEFLRPCSRRDAYEADITYGTNSEFGFDYLRDNTAFDPRELRQRGHYYAIVDEIDSILIDEARTPLIISMPSMESENLYAIFAGIAGRLKEGEDYIKDEKFHSIALTDEGIGKAEKFLGIENIYTDRGVKYVHHLETAVRAKALYIRDKDYVVRNGEVVIVDEFTGRMQHGRRWSEGLHQAVEAKEGVRVQRESRTAASITYQNYFRMYEKLSGMTGTAATSSEEFFKVYGLEVVEIPTNRPLARVDYNDLVFRTENGKFIAIAKKVKELNEKGKPVLIGTVSIEKNETLSAYLRREGIPHQMLNAKNHEQEGQIIAQAGRKDAVTVATNMAGRGVDIKLGGNPSTKEEYGDVKNFGGLFVLGTERHEARRIDNQLRGRSGRQGDPGETQFFVSLEDPLIRVFAPEMLKKIMERSGIEEDMPIENRMITRSIETAQTKIEGFHFDSRKRILEYDDVLNHQRRSVYARRRKLLVGALEEVEAALGEVALGDEELPKIISAKKAQLGEDEFWNIARRLVLQITDAFWMDHLEVMDYIRSSVGLRAYGQRDPLVEYKKDGLRLFREMQEGVKAQIAEILPYVGAGAFAKEEDRLRRESAHIRLSGGGPAPSLSQQVSMGVVQSESDAFAVGMENVAVVAGAGSEATAPTTFAKTTAGSKSLADKSAGRNDPCPCGSGKKYKKCHGQ